MRVFETVEIVAASLPFIALGLSGDLYSTFKVAKWAYQGVDQVIQNSDGTRTYKCGFCGEEGHNRRTCDENVSCDGCGNKEPDEVWEKDGNTVCNDCI
ncbi:MAG: hypothetical protein MK169_00925 [Candidatus Thalassarchaeum sp.]|nr:hypothetical protein [Candidatus Thalassarchaeum sp.]